jgi:hypothetical protein
MISAGWLPSPDRNVIVLPSESVTVNVTSRLTDGPSAVDPGSPQVSVKLNVFDVLSCVNNRDVVPKA